MICVKCYIFRHILSVKCEKSLQIKPIPIMIVLIVLDGCFGYNEVQEDENGEARRKTDYDNRHWQG